ncbi:MAG: 50S ribosomal protein L11 methyltransferase [Pseudomonadota bacterium]
MTPADFVLANTVLGAPSLVPEIRLYLADEALPLWQKTEAELEEDGLPPPFWAFAWAGGQALARHVLDHPALVAGRKVLDLGAGGGIGAIAACRAGARAVVAAEIDPFAVTALALNAAANDTAVETIAADILDGTTDAEVVLAGDLFYERNLAKRTLGFLGTARARGAEVLIGDPNRTYLPKHALVPVATYRVPTPRALEDSDIKRTTVWTLR